MKTTILPKDSPTRRRKRRMIRRKRRKKAKLKKNNKNWYEYIIIKSKNIGLNGIVNPSLSTYKQCQRK
jgi:hypothetical protein